jgi:site-specific DNA-methyltransferase (adenine-specific)
MATKTSSFGTGKREGHSAAAFYNRQMFSVVENPTAMQSLTTSPVEQGSEWMDRIYNTSSEHMREVPSSSVGLSFTSPPYNVGKEYEGDLGMDDYLDLVENVGREVYRSLVPGGRYVINVANLGRKPYIPLHSLFYRIHQGIGFLPMGEIIWQKGKGASGSCAWGSWMSAKSPRLRDLHEYLLVFAKDCFGRPDKGISDIGRDDFMDSTLSIWNIRPESAKRVGHPAPFPIALAERVIKLYSYVGDTVLDPFSGSGTTCVAAKRNDRHFVGYDVSGEYCQLAEDRLSEQLL